MPSYLTRSQLLQFGKYSTKRDILLEQSWRSPSIASVFLSHSHKDQDLVLRVRDFLQSQGVQVYVDWLDNGLPETPNAQTAAILRNKIRENRHFLLLVTENSLNSRWVPWELGTADGQKGPAHIAILPVTSAGFFQGNEYLDLYPRVETSDFLRWNVGPQSLREWLARS